MNLARGSMFICPLVPPTTGIGPNVAPPLHGDNGGGIPMKSVEDTTLGYTTH